MVFVGKQRAGTVSGTVEVIQRRVAGRGEMPNDGILRRTNND
jgi:hypothetical protein